MKKIIKNIPLYYEEGADCDVCNLWNIMKFHDYHKIELFFGLRWGFFYRRKNKNSVAKKEEGGCSISDFKLGPQPQQSLTEDLTRFYGIILKRKSTFNTEKAWSIAKKSLDNNEPLILTADTYYLRYNRNYQRVHGAHSMTLYGYDEEKDKAYVIDWYPPSFFKEIVSIKALKKARNSLNPKESNDPYRASGFPIRNSWLDIKYPSHHIKLDDNLIKEIILENIEIMLEDNSKKNYFQGIRGINAFAKDVLGWRGISNGKNLLTNKMKKEFYYLIGIQEQRTLHFRFLSTISKRLEKLESRRISKELAEILQGWQVVRAMFLKGSKKEPKAILPRISTRLLDIADREEKVLLSLKDIILPS